MVEKTIPEKMFIKPGELVLLANPAKGYEGILNDLPQGCRLAGAKDTQIDTIVFFLTSNAEMEEELPGLKNKIKKSGKLWAIYPKGTSQMKTDINRDSLAAYGQSIGLQGVAMIAIDETWSGLRFKLI